MLTGNELARGLGTDQVKAMGFNLSNEPIETTMKTRKYMFTIQLRFDSFDDLEARKIADVLLRCYNMAKQPNREDASV